MDPKNIMQDKDLVILFMSQGNIEMIQLSSDKKAIFNCKFGSFPHSLFIGQPYGTQIWSSDHRGYLHALRPTSQLLTESLAHRTQIIYSTDIAVIVSSLELRNGCTVVESGTGSGSLSVSLARAVAPKGHLYTFEFNKMRADGAAEDFKKYGMNEYITVTHRDVIAGGFMLPGLERVAHGVFLDLPNPWGAIEHATKVLRDYGKLCNFSPCIEQVQKCAEAMEKLGFIDIKTYECLSRHFDSRSVEIQPLLSVPEAKPKEEAAKEEAKDNSSLYKKKKKMGCYEKSMDVAHPYHNEKGHTGYLTFAVYPGPETVPSSSAVPKAETSLTK